jgi:diguanylate cyclase (GGDEF)-like protein
MQPGLGPLARLSFHRIALVLNAHLRAVNEKALLERDVAQLLYSHGVGGLFVTAVSGTALVAMLYSPSSRVSLLFWLSFMLLTVVARASDLFSARARREAVAWSGPTEIRRFGSGVLATAAVWAIFPLLFFHELNQVERTTLAIIVSAMAGGSATVLAAEQRLAVIYCGALLLPSSIMFLLTPGRESVILGLLGIVFFIVIASASRVTNRATMEAIRLNRANQTLIAGMDIERRRTECANAELTIAQSTLHETLETLEDRIVERTAALEHEINERERYAAELARLASRDSLTGFYNRATLCDRLGSERMRAERLGTSVAVLFLDLDHFKEVNDLKGHYWGDHVLREVAHRLSMIVPEEAISARWGGDEFVFVIGNLPTAQAAKRANAVATQLRRSVCGPIVFGTEMVRVDATIGIALFPDHGRTPDELMRAADMAMYAAKESGRGRVRTFDPALAAELRERRLIEEALREAIANDELRLEFQPIVDAANWRCRALEALVRWENPTRGTIGPTEFIPIAERSGDIIGIGQWVLGQACAAAAGWPGIDPPAVSLNVSVAQIVGGNVVDDVRAALHASGLAANRLHLEVTETLFASDHKQIIPTLLALRAMGIRISLDDFGTGFSSLSYLRSLPIDAIKIDKSFVDDVHNDSGPIIRAIRSLADAFNIEVIAEGVETVDEAALLLSMGINFLQGFLFARPLPQGEVAAWLVDAGDNAMTTECPGADHRWRRCSTTIVEPVKSGEFGTSG